MIKVEACLMEPETTAVTLSGACEATISSQGNEKFRVELDDMIAGRSTLLNVTDNSISFRDVGKLETSIWTRLLPAKHSLTKGLFRVIEGKISRIKFSVITLDAVEEIEID